MKNLCFFFFCSITLTTFGQSGKFTFKLGSEYELPRKSEDLAFFGNEQDGIINLSLKKEELNIVKFDPQSLKQIIEKRIDLSDITKNFNSEEVIDFNNHNYYWLHSDWDKSNERELLYYDRIDVSAGKISESNHKMLEASKIDGSKVLNGFYSWKTVGKYSFDFSADRNLLLVSYKLIPETRNKKNNFDKIGLYVFDDKMNKLWGNEFVMPYNSALMNSSDYSVDSYGNAYLLAKVYDNESRKEIDKSTGQPAYHYEVLKFSKGNKSPVIAPMKVEDGFIKEATLIENPQHQMIIACSYSKKSRGNGTDGIFLAILEQDGKVNKYKSGYFEFPKEELGKFASARTRHKIEKKDDYETPNLKVRNVLVDADGGVFIACEEYHVEEHTYMYSNGTMYTTFTYHYDDILASKLDPTGKFEWMRKIPKLQQGSRGRGTMSFKLISDATGYYFLYLDNLKNLHLPEDEAPKMHLDGAGGQVIVAKLDKTGTLTKDLLFDTREEDIMIFPADFSRINESQFIGRAKLKKTLYQPLLITVH